VFRQKAIDELRNLKILDLPLALGIESLHPQMGSCTIDINQNLRAGHRQNHSIDYKNLIRVFIGIITLVILNQEEEHKRVQYQNHFREGSDFHKAAQTVQQQRIENFKNSDRAYRVSWENSDPKSYND
jgi:hypothetical protein